MIEDSIATEAKFAYIMRRLEAIESKDYVSVNQVSPTPPAGYTYYQVMNHVFKEYPIFLAYQMLPEPMNVIFTRPTNNLY